MKVTFPHMGNLHIPIRALLEDLGVEVVVPPLPTQRTIALGALHSPEFACYPLKLNLGNFIEAYHLGADTILMAGGVGPCRFGYYAQVQKQILDDLGYSFEMIVLEPPRGHLGGLWERIRRLTGNQPVTAVWKAIKFAWAKFVALDEIDRVAQKIRPREARRGDTSRVYRRALQWVDEADSMAAVKKARTRALEALHSIEQDRGREVLRAGIVGEVFMVLEPFANLEVERRLGEMGVEVTRSVFISDWIRAHLFLDALRLKGGRAVKEAARPYLNHFVGGEGQESVGYAALFAREGIDGVIQIAPLTCMPEIVAQSVLPQLSSDYQLPVMTLYLDEHSAEAGVLTRLEAFVDLLARRHRTKEGRPCGVIWG